MVLNYPFVYSIFSWCAKGIVICRSITNIITQLLTKCNTVRQNVKEIVRKNTTKFSGDFLCSTYNLRIKGQQETFIDMFSFHACGGERKPPTIIVR